MRARLSSNSTAQVTEAEAVRRLRVAEAKRAELRLRRETGEVLDAEEVRRTWANAIITVRNRLLALGDALCVQVAAESDVLKCRALINDEVRDALTELSQGQSEADDDAPAPTPAATCGTKEGTQ